ncbi:MAG: hypothetical protein K9M10_02320 [Candidatus Pacebacteria bacterium]|nr:hypothetical protein [Candidatus Paceibacterota bacterium]MCF7857290.1 hypothetical protein [Candidatus Paceibacterota bacterium]
MYTEETIKNHHHFFDNVITALKLKKVKGNVVPVLHILPDAIPFVAALKKIADIPFVIPKPKTIDYKAQDQLVGTTIIDVVRAEIGQEQFINRIPKTKTAFLDIGGYFAPAIPVIQDHLGSDFCGVTEDTENGFQKYIKAGFTFPFINLARSPLKQNEDHMVGMAIGYSIERILREHNMLLNGLKFGVIGYGKVGRSISESMKIKQANVTVADSDSISLTHAFSHGLNTNTNEQLLESSDVICIATGCIALKEEEFSRLKNGSWVFSVTSSDDALDIAWLKENYERQEISTYVDKYIREDHYFYVVNSGNSINFIHGTTVGDFILLVQAELLVALYRLLTEDKIGWNMEVGKKERQTICSHWLTQFSK